MPQNSDSGRHRACRRGVNGDNLTPRWHRGMVVCGHSDDQVEEVAGPTAERDRGRIPLNRVEMVHRSRRVPTAPRWGPIERNEPARYAALI